MGGKVASVVVGVRVLHEGLPMPIFCMVRMEEERSRIRDGEIDNLRWLLDIRRMDRIPNARIRELRGVGNGVKASFDGLAILKE